MANRKYKNATQAHKAQLRADYKYKRKAMTPFTVRFHNVSDAEVIAKLKNVDNRCDYIRQLVLEDLKNNGN